MSAMPTQVSGMPDGSGSERVHPSAGAKAMMTAASYGLGAIFFLGLATICFLIPAALVATELGTAWQRDGGVYLWVSEAFGPRAGFVATWLQSLQNVIFWTVILTAMLAQSAGWDTGMSAGLRSAGDEQTRIERTQPRATANRRDYPGR